MAAVASALISSPAPLGALLLGSRHAVGILRRAHAWKGSAAARRTASQAVIVRLRSLKSPRKVFQFVAEDPQIDAPSLELALRALLRILASGKYSREKVISNVRFHDLLSTLSARLDECDARTLALSADAAARFRAPSKELVAFAERAAEAAVVRRNAFTPRNISLLALACASRGVRGAGAAPVGVHASGDDELATGRGLGAAVEFVRGESFRQMQDFTPASCAMVLEAFWRWGIHDRELFDAALERVWDTYQQLTCKDLVELLVAMSNHGLARPALLRRLSQLAFENLDLFSPRQLVALFHALARFRFFFRWLWPTPTIKSMSRACSRHSMQRAVIRPLWLLTRTLLGRCAHSAWRGRAAVNISRHFSSGYSSVLLRAAHGCGCSCSTSFRPPTVVKMGPWRHRQRGWKLAQRQPPLMRNSERRWACRRPMTT
eukprot:TRINITY_DN38423_c0_g1_i1.p1 TRINITY_DN38423_c0_g1~~TRINITY_DN38423_c0_g1_i1.p1  ORF type:complete len:444 (+),score=63.50 TRINITY_DN38423_c0_g1_i1:33-1334(+)